VSACLAVLLGSRGALAQLGPGGPIPKHFPHAAPTPPPSKDGPGKIRVTTADGERGPVMMVPKGAGFVGEFVVWNDGPGPLTVSRIAMRTDDDDPRLPNRFTARFADGGGGSGIVHAHSSKRVNITWVPDHDPKLHQALGHVVVTSTDEVAGEVAMGFVAPHASLLASHLLSCLLFLPLLGAVVALAMRIVGFAGHERLRGLFVALTGAQCLLAIVLFRGFGGAVVRADGNDGFQFIERSVLVPSLGVEYFVGVDGVSVGLVLLAALVGFVGAVASAELSVDRLPRGLPLYYALFGLLLAATMGVFVSLDLALFAGWWVLMLAALVALVATSASDLSRPVVRALLAYGGASALFLVFAVSMLHARSDPTFLADGVRAAHTFSLPELMRVAYNAKHLEILGCSWVKVVWGALFLAFAITIPLVPLHRWFAGVLGEAPAPVAVVLGSVVLKTGLYGLLRVSIGVLPDGSRWAATTLVAFGVLTLAVGALSLLRGGRLLDGVASVAMAQAGFCLLGLGAMTREGIAGCLLQMVSHGLMVAVLILVAASPGAPGEGRPSRAAPLAAASFGVAFLGIAGVPGLPGFWGEVLPVLGAFPAQRALTVVAVVLAIVIAVTQARALGGIVQRGLPALGPRLLGSVVPLLVLAIALGLCPAPFFSLVQGGVADENQLVNPPGPDEIALLGP
jgi:NADH-quinone oxidoreductase subunit M